MKFVVFFFLAIFASQNVDAAKTVAVVESVRGHAFSILGGKTVELKVSDLIEDFSEVYVELDGLVTLRSGPEHFYHLSSGSHVHFLNKIVELKKGAIWFQNKNGKISHDIQSANAIVTYWGGEGIVSFEAKEGKTQFLSINGSMEFSNILDKEFVVVVDPSNFSLVDDESEQGKPRQAMSIGKKSFESFLAYFPGVTPLAPVDKGPTLEQKTSTPQMVAEEDDIINQAIKKNPSDSQEKTNAPERKLASVSESSNKIVMRRLPEVARVKEFNIENYHGQKIENIKKEKKNRIFVPEYRKKSSVPVKIFGMKSAANVVAEVIPTKIETVKQTERAPASTEAFKKELADPMEKTKGHFESELVKQYKSQMRHSNEVNSLINDLKSYQQDYQKDY